MILSLPRDKAESEKENKSDLQVSWIGELMAEQQIRALPRSMEQLGRCYGSREFWETFDLMPAWSGTMN